MAHKNTPSDILILDAEGELVYRRTSSVMTPRSACIEAPHIISAYVDGNQGARHRIETYGRLEQERLSESIRIAPGFRCPFEGRAIIFAPQLKSLTTCQGIDSVPDHRPDEPADE